MHYLKAVRSEINSRLNSSNIRVDVGGIDTPVLILEGPPSGSSIDERDLPAIFVFISSEKVEKSTNRSDTRTARFSVNIYARDEDNPIDQLDDIQSQVEISLFELSTLAGRWYDLSYEEMSSVLDQGRVVFSSRTLRYRCVASVTSNNPNI